MALLEEGRPSRRLGGWLSSKLSELMHKSRHDPFGPAGGHSEMSDAGCCSPLDANRRHRPVPAKPSSGGNASDCGMLTLSSDQLSAVARCVGRVHGVVARLTCTARAASPRQQVHANPRTTQN